MAAALALALAWPGAPRVATAQQPVTRQDAVAAALARGARVALARSDSAAAGALLNGARAWPNPMLAVSFTRDAPQRHVIADLPLDVPWIRGARVRAAEAAATSSAWRFALERASARFDAEAGYTTALAAAAHARLSARTAADADSLLRMARIRRDAGDASELDVALAAVNAGQLANAAAADSLAAVGAVLDLQLVMGLSGDRSAILLADTLALPAPESLVGRGTRLAVAAAEAALVSAEQRLALERHSVLGTPSLEVGVENRDPTGAETGLLPAVGIAIAVPLLNRNRGGIALAAAGVDRARAELVLARRESEASVARASRERAVARAKAQRDRELLASAERVAAMALTAYAEGAVSLPSVLEAQRNAREALGRYIDDLAAALTAEHALRLVAATEETP